MLTIKTASTFLFCAALSALCWSDQPDDYSQKDLNEEIVIAGHWQHYAPEYDALFYQAFNTARQNLPELIQKAPQGKKLAIVTDIDDTLLEGVTYFTSLRGTDQQRTTERSIRWWQNQPTYALPGTVRFFNDAHNQGIEVFYISGRYNEVKEVTIKRLKEFGYPVIDQNHVLLQETDYKVLSKEGKRQAIRDQGYQILMVFGDQLSDLGESPDHDYRLRRQWVIDNKAHFGRDWYLLPNVAYGAWEESLAPDYSKMTPQEKHDSRLAALGNSRFHVITDQDYARHLTLASVWTHTSADFTALCYQAYNRAGQLISKTSSDLYNNPVIIADIDGTVLDFTPAKANLTNTPADIRTPFEQNGYLTEHQYSKPIPGAVDFLNAASQKGYEIFYVSSRPLSTTPAPENNNIEKATIDKLSEFHFPFADQQHVLLKEEFCSSHGKEDCRKEHKRTAIRNGAVDHKKHDIVMIIGDFMSDFSLTEQQLSPDQKESVAAAAQQFGNDYIVIPNPLNTIWQRQFYSREANKQGKDFKRMNWSEQAEIRRSLTRDWPDKFASDHKSE
ncbi:hypothetical protein GZ77_02510 [Endozoicomonas montiporae]|uniref:Acid phosphatase n=2 Tax=Endozoicomonas montiporae TaxID=1027273 RepID=A0A081NAP4_9GAMM|nr:HAD family acid phosphatase [Endozoicomonas montiporae]AMO56792.1 5'-nucleotidase [Endozoicomonas montiporae CL-33]KEQ15517.1 hypothetical protein GZ77_02510 [Endozoicomonas montiporae]